MILYIKNMVCPRCVRAVEAIFRELHIIANSITLGQVEASAPLTADQKTQLKEKLQDNGFVLLEDNKSKLISQIKAIIIDQVHHNEEPLKVNFSSHLAEKLHHEYSYLSKLFSQVEGMTIERFIVKQKIERVKELIFYSELTLTEIAYEMNYSSSAHLSAQFKKETGMTPSQFKLNKNPERSSLDEI